MTAVYKHRGTCLLANLTLVRKTKQIQKENTAVGGDCRARSLEIFQTNAAQGEGRGGVEE